MCEETRTNIGAKLVAIHMALVRFEDHPWLGIFTDSLSSMHAIHLHHNKCGRTAFPHYHHRMLLLKIISELLEASRDRSFSTSLRKIRAHALIRGNDLS